MTQFDGDVAAGKACIAFATGDPTFEEVFGLVDRGAWFWQSRQDSL